MAHSAWYRCAGIWWLPLDVSFWEPRLGSSGILLANPASIPSHRRLADRNGRVFEARGLVGIRPVYESTALKLINEREIRKMPCSA